VAESFDTGMEVENMQRLLHYVVLPVILLLISTGADADLGFRPVTKGRKSIAAWHVKQNSVDYVTWYWQRPAGAVASIDMNGTATISTTKIGNNGPAIALVSVVPVNGEAQKVISHR
jgi:hypothetical protein